MNIVILYLLLTLPPIQPDSYRPGDFRQPPIVVSNPQQGADGHYYRWVYVNGRLTSQKVR